MKYHHAPIKLIIVTQREYYLLTTIYLLLQSFLSLSPSRTTEKENSHCASNHTSIDIVTAHSTCFPFLPYPNIPALYSGCCPFHVPEPPFFYLFCLHGHFPASLHFPVSGLSAIASRLFSIRGIPGGKRRQKSRNG